MGRFLPGLAGAKPPKGDSIPSRRGGEAGRTLLKLIHDGHSVGVIHHLSGVYIGPQELLHGNLGEVTVCAVIHIVDQLRIVDIHLPGHVHIEAQGDGDHIVCGRDGDLGGGLLLGQGLTLVHDHQPCVLIRAVGIDLIHGVAVIGEGFASLGGALDRYEHHGLVIQLQVAGYAYLLRILGNLFHIHHQTPGGGISAQHSVRSGVHHILTVAQNLIKEYQSQMGNTVLFVSHSMEDVAKLCKKVIVMNKGEIAFCGSVNEVYSHGEELKEMGLNVPEVTDIFLKLKASGVDCKTDIYTVEQGVEEYKRLLGGAVD